MQATGVSKRTLRHAAVTNHITQRPEWLVNCIVDGTVYGIYNSLNVSIIFLGASDNIVLPGDGRAGEEKASELTEFTDQMMILIPPLLILNEALQPHTDASRNVATESVDELFFKRPIFVYILATLKICQMSF